MIKKRVTLSTILLSSLSLGLALSLSGCASTYQVSTFDGRTFKSQSAPVLIKGAYEFETADDGFTRLPYVQVKSVNRL
jgi:hypothetical protein